MKEHVGNQELK